MCNPYNLLIASPLSYDPRSGLSTSRSKRAFCPHRICSKRIIWFSYTYHVPYEQSSRNPCCFMLLQRKFGTRLPEHISSNQVTSSKDRTIIHNLNSSDISASIKCTTAIHNSDTECMKGAKCNAKLWQQLTIAAFSGPSILSTLRPTLTTGIDGAVARFLQRDS